MAKIKIELCVEHNIDLSVYVDPDSNDYPYEEQIADQIVKGEWWDYEDLIEGTVEVTILENEESNE